jgi:succinate dehydrogenase / fumarate reductase cytochrome b subunit
MEQSMPSEHRKALRWGEFDPHRQEHTRIGMWAWLAQRISALAVVVLLVLHVTLTYKPLLQFLLLAVATFHTALGVRIILLDFKIVDVKYQRALIWGFLGLGVVVFLITWLSIYHGIFNVGEIRLPVLTAAPESC